MKFELDMNNALVIESVFIMKGRLEAFVDDVIQISKTAFKYFGNFIKSYVMF